MCTRSRSPLQLALPKRPHQPIADVIEWDAHVRVPIERPGRSEATLRRIAAGRAVFGELRRALLLEWQRLDRAQH